MGKRIARLLQKHKLEMEVPIHLEGDFERIQRKINTAVRNHRVVSLKLKSNPDSMSLKTELEAAKNDIKSASIELHVLLDPLRKELQSFHANIKATVTQQALEQMTRKTKNFLNKTRKQYFDFQSASVTPCSTLMNSLNLECTPPPSQQPHDPAKVEFLAQMGLVPNEVYKEMQNKRIKRKRTSTVNSEFLYESRSKQPNKRKKSTNITSSVSPPNTRQAARNKKRAAQRSASFLNNCDSRSLPHVNKETVPPVLNIPNLPAVLTIEDTNEKKTPDNTRVGCLSCYPRLCYKPLLSESKALEEMLQQRDKLKERNKILCAEQDMLFQQLNYMCDAMHSQSHMIKQLYRTEYITRMKIQRVIHFLNILQNSEPARVSHDTPTEAHEACI